MICQDARSLILSKLNTVTTPQSEKVIILQNYDELALKSFIWGLSDQGQNNVWLWNLDLSLILSKKKIFYIVRTEPTRKILKSSSNQHIN